MENKDQIKDEQPVDQSVVTGVGAVAGGIVGAAIGHAVNKKLGGVVGAVAGGIAGGALAEFSSEVIDIVQPSLGFGADNRPIELPNHYTWEELQALSKPQSARGKQMIVSNPLSTNYLEMEES